MAVDDAAADGLTVGEPAAWTGVRAATLRTWETRYGFPRPSGTPPLASADLRRATGLLSRMTGYLESSGPAPRG
jgi:hypothetical protein